jgi:uncharacterized protein (TIGR00369 family)
MTPLDRAGLLRLADVYHQSPIGRTTGMRITFADDGAATCHWRSVTDYDHALASVHGGLLATMLDNAGWFTAAAAHGEWVVTSDLHLRLLQATSGRDLHATGRVVRAGRRLSVVAAELWDADGELIATATGSFCPTGKPLPAPEPTR